MIAARIPLANLAAARATLAAAGHGPENFAVPVWDDRIAPTHAVLHSWGDNLADFHALIKTLPGVTWSETEGTPQDRVSEALSSINGQYGGNAPELTGVVSPGLHRDAEGTLWWVIQGYDTSVYPDPSAPGLLALVRRARIPGTVEEWVQPLDQYDAYYVVNPFTGEPDRVLWFLPTDTEKTGPLYEWECSEQSAAGGFNTQPPGVFGWTLVNPPEPQTGEWQEGDSFAVGDLRTYNGVTYRCITAHTAWVGTNWTPPTSPTLWELA